VAQALQFVHVRVSHFEAGDDQDVVRVAALVESVQDGEQVRADAGQERVGGLVQELNGSDVGLECGVAGQQGHG
jgi:hypothetical protein